MTSATTGDSATAGTTAGESTGVSTHCLDGRVDAGDLCFGDPQFLVPTYRPSKVARADVNGDQHLDLITTEFNDSAVGFHYGTGAGGFRGTSGASVTPPANDVAVGHFNDDAFTDVAFGLNSVTQTIGVFLGDGVGVLPDMDPYVISTSIATGRAVAIADIDGEGHDDIVVAGARADSTAQDGRVLVFLAATNGDGTFATSPVINNHPDGFYTDIVAADFNGDTIMDVALSYIATGGSGVRVCRGNGMGRFDAASCEALDGGDDPRALAAGDFDQDGDIDLAVTQSAGNQLLLYRGVGTGAFFPANVIPSGTGTWGIAAGDLNNDGLVDLIVSHPASATLSIVEGVFGPNWEINGTLNLGDAMYIPEDIVLGDLNEDGSLDVAVTCRGYAADLPHVAIFNSAP